MSPPSVCFVGLLNLPVLAPEYAERPSGGAQLQQVLLAKALAKRGWPVSMIVADWGQPDGASWQGIRTIKAYRPDEGLPLVRFLYPRWMKLQRALRRADADIYYTSCAGAEVGQVVLFARRSGRQVVFRVASNSDCDPKALLVQYRRDRLLYRYGLARADQVLAQTAHQQEALRRHYGRRSRIVPSLIEPAERCRELETRDIDVLWVGHIRSFKRADLLLEAARRLPGIRFHLVGGRMPGSEELYDALQREARTLPNVTFHGAVPYRQTLALYERARLFVSTSEIEGFPNTYLQSWAHGTPVVAFLDPDGVIERSSSGQAVQTLEQMCAAIAALSRDRARWALASARARDYMQRHCDESHMLAPYIAALTGLRGAGTRGPRTDPAPALPACRSVLMVGTDLKGMGGVRAVVQGYIEGGLFDKIDCAYVATHRYGSRLAKMSAAVTGWLRVIVRLHTLDAPLVHVHISPGASFWRKSVVCALARISRRPYILHVHAGPFEKFYEESAPAARRIVRAVFARAALVIALTQSWRAILERISPGARIDVMPNGVSLPSASDLHRTTERQPSILFLGDVGRHKGVFDLVHAFARIADRFPRLRLVFGGVGATEEIRRLASELGLAGRIECAGWLDAQRKRAALAGAAVFVLPSYMEGVPMAVLEAMSCGLPPVATAVGGVPEIITHEVNGLLVAPGDIAALADALARLQGDRQLRERLGSAARATVAARFSLEGTVEQLLAIYRRFGIEPRAAYSRRQICLEATPDGK